MFDPIALLAELVRIPSENPLFPSAVAEPAWGGTGAPIGLSGEARLTVYLESLFASLGIPTRRVPVLPGRDNLLAWIEGRPSNRGRRRVLLFDAHQDTVSAEGMTIEPFAAELREGRLYGRGACDTKGGMAAAIVAAERLAADPPPAMPSLLLAFTINEEHGFDGARRLAAAWGHGSSRAGASRDAVEARAEAIEPFPDWRPDAAVVLEPTGLDVVTAHKGVVRWRCTARGRSAHSSRPEEGLNAIYRMARAVAAIERYADGALARREADAHCGRPTLCVTTIQGGTSVNTVPDRCTIQLDRRLVPGEDPEAARHELIDALAAEGAGSLVEHETPQLSAPALEATPESLALAGRLASAVASVRRAACAQRGAAYATNAACYAAVGIPAVVFGPGSVAQAHTADEWIAAQQVVEAAAAIERFVRAEAG